MSSPIPCLRSSSLPAPQAGSNRPSNNGNGEANMIQSRSASRVNRSHRCPTSGRRTTGLSKMSSKVPTKVPSIKTKSRRDETRRAPVRMSCCSTNSAGLVDDDG